MTRYFILFLVILTLQACTKTVITFTGGANENFELPMILHLNGVPCSFDQESNTFKFSIAAEELTDFSPLVEFNASSSVTFESEELANKSINKIGNLSLNQDYELTIETNGKANIFKLRFTDIPIIQLITRDPIITGYNSLCRFVVNYPSSEKPTENSWAEVKHRGQTSLQFDKKSFGISLFTDQNMNNPVAKAFFDLKANTHWILNAMFVDDSRLRNKVTFELWNAMGDPEKQLGIQSIFTEVFVNNKSYGLFCLTENYTDILLNLSSESVLYKSTDNSDVTKFSTLPSKKPKSAFWAEWEQKHPEPSESINWDDFENLYSVIVEVNDQTFAETIGNMLDIENIIDYYLFVNLTGATDNVGKNVFFLKDNQQSKFKILPWDLDATWGRDASGFSTGNVGIITNRLFERLEEVNSNSYRQLVKERWFELRLGVFSEANLNNLFSEAFIQLKDYEIIDLENRIWSATLNLEIEENFISTWLAKRLVFLDAHFED